MYFYVEYINDETVVTGRGDEWQRWKMCKFGDFAIMNSEHEHWAHVPVTSHRHLTVQQHNQISGINMNVYFDINLKMIIGENDGHTHTHTLDGTRHKRMNGTKKCSIRLAPVRLWINLSNGHECVRQWRWGKTNECGREMCSTLYVSFHFGMFCMICSFRPCIIRFLFLPSFPCSMVEESALKNSL